MPFRIASPSLRGRALVVSIITGLVLAGGFLPTSRSLGLAIQHYAPWPLLPALAFPALAGFFCLTTAPPPTDGGWLPLRKALWTIPFPVVISAIFGWFHPSPSVFELARSPSGREAILWFAFCIPLGEEWLFRGWMQSIGERFAPLTRLSETNPLPLSVWASTIGFSLWHLQNGLVEPWALVAFQVVYTFLTGLWLGYLRWATGRIFPCILSHFALNLASNLW